MSGTRPSGRQEAPVCLRPRQYDCGLQLLPHPNALYMLEGFAGYYCFCIFHIAVHATLTFEHEPSLSIRADSVSSTLSSILLLARGVN